MSYIDIYHFEPHTTGNPQNIGFIKKKYLIDK